MSTNRRIYLDFNATAPLVPAARDAMVEAMADVGNPSSVHAEGRRMRDRVERARNQVATLVGRPREQIVFTSGGTEANWLGVMALAAAAEKRGLPKVVATTSIEHPSLRGAVEALRARGWSVRVLPPDPEKADSLGDIGLIALALVNHEVGTVRHIYSITFGMRALVHVDAVQAVGKLPAGLDFHGDALAISAHKIGGPQGVGALVIKLDEGLPVIDGGHQERGRRPGTENTLGIIGFGAAAGAIDPSAWPRVIALGDQLEAGLRALGAAITTGANSDVRGAGDVRGAAGADEQRVGGTINARFPGARGESIVMALDLEGISVSTGAACTSGSIQPSAVLLGLGFSEEEAREAVRFSLGPTTTADEITRVLEVLPGIVERARRHR
jgi:cysteine desulfurase